MNQPQETELSLLKDLLKETRDSNEQHNRLMHEMLHSIRSGMGVNREYFVSQSLFYDSSLELASSPSEQVEARINNPLTEPVEQSTSATTEPVPLQQQNLPAEPSGLSTRLASIETAVLTQQKHLAKVLGEFDVGKTMTEMNGSLKTLQTEALKGMCNLLFHRWLLIPSRRSTLPGEELG